MVQEKKRLICIDESGSFESREAHARFLGGCVYTGVDAIGKEEYRLKRMFEALADRISERYSRELNGHSFRYPYSFHMSDLFIFDGETRIQIEDDALIRKIRREILDGVKQDLAEHKKGYRIFAMLVPFQNTAGYEADSETREFNLTDFRDPGVLYQRLITGLVHDFTFYSLETDIAENVFKIASRTPVISRSEVTGEQLERLRALNGVQQHGGKVYLSPTDRNLFKASLAEKMFEKRAINRLAVKRTDIDCRSINYSDAEREEISPFYYLADVICYYLQRLIYGENGNGNYADYQINSEELERISRDCVVPIFFWSYEEADSIFKRAVECYAEGRLGETFSALYQLERAGSSCCDYYVNWWKERLCSLLKSEYEDNRNEEFAQRLPQEIAYVEQLMSQANYDEAEYVLRNLQQVLEQGDYAVLQERAGRALAYRIQDLFLRIHNHHGSVQKSKKCFKSLLAFSDAVSTEVLAESVNRAAQIYFNQMEYEPLEKLYSWLTEEAEGIRAAYQNQKDMMDVMFQEVFDEEAPAENSVGTQLAWIGKMYSSMGQVYAFLGKYEEAQQCFGQAVREYSQERDVRRTMGYQLHAWIAQAKDADARDACREKYLKESPAVLGGETTAEQLRRMLRETEDLSQIRRYDLYIWIKAVWQFRLQDGDREVRNGIRQLAKNLAEKLRTAGNQESTLFAEHPWELIFKYLYYLCTEMPELQEIAGLFAVQAGACHAKDEETVLVIKQFFHYQNTDSEEEKQELMKSLEQLGGTIGGLWELKNAGTMEEKEKVLEAHLTYMYV